MVTTTRKATTRKATTRKATTRKATTRTATTRKVTPKKATSTMQKRRQVGAGDVVVGASTALAVWTVPTIQPLGQDSEALFANPSFGLKPVVQASGARGSLAGFVPALPMASTRGAPGGPGPVQYPPIPDPSLPAPRGTTTQNPGFPAPYPLPTTANPNYVAAQQPGLLGWISDSLINQLGVGRVHLTGAYNYTANKVRDTAGKLAIAASGAKGMVKSAYDAVVKPTHIQTIREQFMNVQTVTTRAWNTLPPVLQRAASNQVCQLLIVLLLVGTAVSILSRRAIFRYYRDIRSKKSDRADIKASSDTLAAIHKAQAQPGISASERQILAILETTANRGAVPEGLHLTKDDLKQACRAKGLTVSGTNEELSTRVVDDLERDLDQGIMATRPLLPPKAPARKKPAAPRAKRASTTPRTRLARSRVPPASRAKPLRA